MSFRQAMALKEGDIVSVQHDHEFLYRVNRVYAPQQTSAGPYAIIEVYADEDPDTIYSYPHTQISLVTEGSE